MKFIIITAVYNMEPWIADNINMLKQQTYDNFRCFIGDDLSTDNSVAVTKSAIKDDSRFELITHNEKKFSMGNIYQLIQHAQPDDEDVIVLVDGDDQLAHNKALEMLADIYQQQNCWMTYGCYSDGSSNFDPACKAYHPLVIKFNLFRHVKWRASHLKTFKYKLFKQISPEAFNISPHEAKKALWKSLFKGKFITWHYWRKIKREELLNPSGEYIKRCDDKAMTFPMLEMAGPKAFFVPTIMYHYNTGYDKKLKFDTSKINKKWYTRYIRNVLKNKPKYSRITNL